MENTTDEKKEQVEQTETTATQMRQRRKTDSKFELVIVAAKRCKQLQRGAIARVYSDKKSARHTYIARREVEAGLVSYNDHYGEEND